MTKDTSTIELCQSRKERLRTHVIDAKYMLLAKAGGLLLRGAGIKPEFKDLRYFCLFIGHGRSGGTLVGALLNAHPDVVIANELNALRRISAGLTAQQLYRLIYLVSRRQAARGSRGGGGYSYAVPGQLQGSHRTLLVIGDRKAGATAYEISRHPGVLERLDKTISLGKKFIHVTRNPFDTIATTYQKTSPGPGQSQEEHLWREIHNYFARCETVRLVAEKYGPRAFAVVSNEDIIRDPAQELSRLCRFLEIDPLPDYLNACASIVKSEPHQSRRSIAWSADAISFVEGQSRNFPWLTNYGYRL